MNNLRRVIRGLRPIYLEDLGLVTSLKMLVREMEQNDGNPLISFTTMGLERRFSPQVEMSLYRMVQESLNNIIHHAQALKAQVEVNFNDNALVIFIQDDGKGFDVSIQPSELAEKGHFGLLGLHERAQLIGADIKIDSFPEKGTSVFIKVAYEPDVLVGEI
ncbi:MAG: ATP-binding protein, partial [Anaerolineae bacterium]|nr:ATP-binding protein [Anaerolineae bacterium]